MIMVGDGSGNPGRGGPTRPGRTASGRRVGVVLGIAAVFVFGIVVGRTSVGRGTASPSVTASTTAPATAAPTTHPTAPGSTRGAGASTGASAPEAVPPALDPAFAAAVSVGIPGQTDIEGLAAVDDHLVALAAGWLADVVVDSHGGLYPGVSAAVGLPLGDPNYADWALIPAEGAVWAFAPGKRLYSVDPSTLEMGPLIRVPSGAPTAVALDQHVYLNSDVGVYDVTPSLRQEVSLPIVARGGRAIAADPARHRLLVTDEDGPWMIYAYAPPDPTAVAAASLPFDVTSVAAAAGEIWVTGMTTDLDPRPVLARLDPVALHVVGHSILERSLASAPVVVASGTSLWVRSSDSGSQLWCVDATTGTVAQHWSALPGLVAVGGDGVFVARGNVIGRLRLNSSCAG